MIRKKGITIMIKYKFSRIISPVVRICVAVSILVGHLFAGIVLFSLQDSVTCRNAENVLIAEIASVQKSLSLAASVDEPEYMYLFTEYEVVGENGGVIIADSLHDIRCGKRVESCRTLEDAGIDINKYKPLKRYATQVFGVPCHFAYFKSDDAVIISYLPVTEQTQRRNMNVFSALGTTFIFSILLFFLVPLVIQFITKKKSIFNGNVSGADLDSSLADDVFDDGGLDDNFDADDTGLGETDSEPDEYVQDIELPEEEDISPEILAESIENAADEVAGEQEPEQADDGQPEGERAGVTGAETEAGATGAEPEESSFDQNEIADYVSRMQDLKRTAHQLGEEKLFKMADYLEKCGKAILAGSKDADKFMAEIESKTPIAAKYYDSCIQQRDLHALQNDEQPSAPEEEDLPKTDMSPAEIFATLEALYDGASSADDNAVNTQISTLRRINLPRKLNAVFPELELAAEQSDFTRIKAVIDSLRTSKT